MLRSHGIYLSRVKENMMTLKEEIQDLNVRLNDLRAEFNDFREDKTQEIIAIKEFVGMAVDDDYLAPNGSPSPPLKKDKYIISCLPKKKGKQPTLYFDPEIDDNWNDDKVEAIQFATMASAEKAAENIKSPKGYGKPQVCTYWLEDEDYNDEDDDEDDNAEKCWHEEDEKQKYLIASYSKNGPAYIREDEKDCEGSRYFWDDYRKGASHFTKEKAVEHISNDNLPPYLNKYGPAKLEKV